MLTAGVSFLDSGTGLNILFNIILCLFSVLLKLQPFVDEQLVRAGGTDAVELIFNMVAALAMKANAGTSICVTGGDSVR